MRDKKMSILVLLGMSIALCVTVMVTGQDNGAQDTSAAATSAPAMPPAVTEPVAMEGAATSAVPVSGEPSVLVNPVNAGAPDTGAVPSTVVGGEAVSNSETAATAADAAPVETIEAEIKEDTGPVPVQTSASKISITLEDVDIADVVKMFTRISGINIITTTTNLVGKVTVNLTDVEWRPALESILDMYNMTLEEKRPGSQVYSIVNKPTSEPLIAKTFFLKFSQVTNVINVIASVVTPGGGSIQAYPSRNAFVIRGTAKGLAEVAEVIKAIDVMRDQAFIEAKFLELNDSAIKDLGISWQVLQAYKIGASGMQMNYDRTKTWDRSREDTLNQTDARSLQDDINQRYDIQNTPYEESTTTYEESPPGSGVYTPIETLTPTRLVTDSIAKSRTQTADVTDSFKDIITDVRTAVLNAGDFGLVLHALKQMDGVQIISNPKLIVANEEPALIHIGTIERPFVSTVIPASQNSGALVSYNPGEAVNIGLELAVTPTINTESNITVKIEPKLRRFLRYDTAPNGQNYPIISEKTIKTVFCLESGKTVAIGGLTETKEAENGNRVPILGSIPILGRLFSYTHEEKTLSETIIFVTVGVARPEDVQNRDGLPQDSKLVERRLLKDELERTEFRNTIEAERIKVDAKIEKAERVHSKLGSK